MVVNNFNTFQQFLRDNDVFTRFGIKQVGVFGSFVRGEKYNDIDILIDRKLDYETRMALKQYIEIRLNVPVDVIMKDYAEPIILHRALKEVKYATATDQ